MTRLTWSATGACLFYWLMSFLGPPPPAVVPAIIYRDRWVERWHTNTIKEQAQKSFTLEAGQGIEFITNANVPTLFITNLNITNLYFTNASVFHR